MRKFILISMLIVVVFGVIGCSNKGDTIEFEELYNNKVDNGTEVRISGKTAYFFEVDQKSLEDNVNAPELEIDGPTQFIKLVNENSKAMDVYNELDVTGREVLSKGEEIIVEGKVYNIEGTVVPAIHATNVEGT